MRVLLSMRVLLLAAVLAISASGAVTAAEDWASAEFNRCVAKANESDSEMAGCAQEEFDRNDKALNAAYASRMKEADDPLKTALKASQRAWLPFRDRTCEAEGALYSGGTLEKVAYGNCEARVTAERVKWIKALDP